MSFFLIGAKFIGDDQVIITKFKTPKSGFGREREAVS